MSCRCSAGSTAGDDSSVEAGEVKAAGESGMFDLGAAVLDCIHPCLGGDDHGLVVLDTKLEPKGCGPEVRGVLDRKSVV